MISESKLALIKQLSKSHRDQNGKLIRAMVLAKCECGNIVEVRMDGFKSGSVKSCGCLIHNNKSRFKHGLMKHPLYSVWTSMKSRCNYKKLKSYKYYGARGVAVCKEWADSFKSFHDWALANGWKSGLHLDKDIKAKKMGVPALIYSPEMCQFVTRKENNKHTRQTVYYDYNGKKMTAIDISEETGMPVEIVRQRLRVSKMSISKALSMPIQNRKRYVFEGQKCDLAFISKKTKIPYSVLNHRILKLKMPLDEALSTPSRKPKSVWVPYI